MFLNKRKSQNVLFANKVTSLKSRNRDVGLANSRLILSPLTK